MNKRIASLILFGVCAISARVSLGAPGDQQASGTLLAASFGADDFGGLGPCAGLGPIDGLPVVFDAPLAVGSVDAADFVIITADGQRVPAQCATFLPSINGDERQTILTQGNYGAPGASPVAVEIVGSIRSADGSVDYEGATVAVVPFEVGAILVYARSLPVSRAVGGIDECPTGTAQVVQLAFGSNAGNNFPVTTDYLGRFRVSLEDGTLLSPFAFGDTTADNYLELCLDQATPALTVDIDAMTIMDAALQLNQVPLSAPVQ